MASSGNFARRFRKRKTQRVRLTDACVWIIACSIVACACLSAFAIYSKHVPFREAGPIRIVQDSVSSALEDTRFEAIFIKETQAGTVLASHQGLSTPGEQGLHTPGEQGLHTPAERISATTIPRPSFRGAGTSGRSTVAPRADSPPSTLSASTAVTSQLTTAQPLLRTSTAPRAKTPTGSSTSSDQHIVASVLTMANGPARHHAAAAADAMPVLVKGNSALTFSDSGSTFLLRGKPLRILSGEMHYFRVVPQYWQDRLLRLRAAGLNTVSTYVPWNLHEPRMGVFDFTENSLTDLAGFVRAAQKVGLFVILRPGPYICAEWEFGGLPAWLLRSHGEEIRTSGVHYLAAVRRYLRKVYAETSRLQMAHGGPIIAVQLENEYGTYGVGEAFRRSAGGVHQEDKSVTKGNDRVYLEALRTAAIDGGIVELLFKCDDGQGLQRELVQLPGVLQTVNSNDRVPFHMSLLRRNQRGVNAPVFVTEFWSGWYSLFGNPFSTAKQAALLAGLSEWLRQNASINFYMWHGGVNFYHNGAVKIPQHRVVTSSYDYDSPVSENGTLMPSFFAIRNLLKETLGDQVVFGDIPAPIPVEAYGAVSMTKYASLELLAKLLHKGVAIDNVLPMEQLPVNGNSGQAMGWTLYRHSTSTTLTNATLSLPSLADYGVIMVNGKVLGRVGHKTPALFPIPADKLHPTVNTIDILVAHFGRNNYLPDGRNEMKGLLEQVSLSGKILTGWTVYPLEFTHADINTLLADTSVQAYGKIPTPCANRMVASNVPQLIYAEFSIDTDKPPRDTYLHIGADWGRGLVILNDAVLGRYFSSGPQHTLYTPAPLLHAGKNTVMLLELERVPCTPQVRFLDKPILGRPAYQ
eukprot:scpid37376/ scgid1836/ Beta-galactosidase-1-like protein 2